MTLKTAVLLVLGAGLVPSRARAQSVVVGPLASSMSAIPNASVTVPLVADMTSSGGASLGSVTGRLTWRPGTLLFTGAGVGTLGTAVLNTDSTAFGILKFALANPAGAAGMPVLLNASFTVTGPATDTSSLGLSVSEITAAATFANLLPITTTTLSRFCVSTGKWGDVDGDTLLTSHDALIIITNAVGLPITPYTVVNGDVDGNGAVDTRDALIVLSSAVGIPVSQFRIGRINPGICSLTSAASVQIQPRSATVAAGDSLPVTAVVRDSSGGITQGVNLVWGSKDPTVVRPGASASLVAVAPGSTYARVIVAPGIKDSIPVTVSTTRHVWYVNPVVAAGNTIELGSQVYPFASIDTAMAHAAAGDTIHVAPATYGPVKIRQPLVMLGDSAAGGYPRLVNASGTALQVDSVGGAVTVGGFRLLNSLKGASVKIVTAAALGPLSVEGVHDYGLDIYGVDSLQLQHVQVIGAVGTGIALDSFRIALLDSVKVDVVSAAGGGGTPLGLHVWNANALSGSDLFVGTAGVRMDTINTVALRRIKVQGTPGTALQLSANRVAVTRADISGANAANAGIPSYDDPTTFAVAIAVGAGFTFDSSVVHDNAMFALNALGGANDSLRADSIVGTSNPLFSELANNYFASFLTMEIAHSYLHGGPSTTYFYATGSTLTVDSTVFDGAPVYVYAPTRFAMNGGAVKNGVNLPFQVYGGGVVAFDSVEVTGTQVTGCCGLAPTAISVVAADSTNASGLWAHDNQGGALGVMLGRVMRVLGGTYRHNGTSTAHTPATILVQSMRDAALYGVTLRDSASYGVYFNASATGGSRSVVDSSFLEGSSTLVGGYGFGGSYHDTLTVTRSSLTGFQATTSYGVDGAYLGRLVVANDVFDSTASAAVVATGDSSAAVSGSQFRAYGGWALEAYNGPIAVTGNGFTGCAPGTPTIYVYGGAATVTGNSLTGCGPFLVANSLTPVAAEVSGNTLTLDTTTVGAGAIDLSQRFGLVHVANNTILGGGSTGIHLDGAGYGIDSVRVDSNTVQLTRAFGIDFGSLVGTRLDSVFYNTLTDDSLGGFRSASDFQAAYNTVLRTKAGTGVAFTGNGIASFNAGNIVGNLPTGLSGPGGADTSFDASGNWWGDALGPGYLGRTGPLTTGDTVMVLNVLNYLTFATAAVAGAPPLVGPPAAQVVRPAIAAARAMRRPPSRAGEPRPAASARRATPAEPPPPVVRAPARRFTGGRP